MAHLSLNTSCACDHSCVGFQPATQNNAVDYRTAPPPPPPPPRLGTTPRLHGGQASSPRSASPHPNVAGSPNLPSRPESPLTCSSRASARNRSGSRSLSTACVRRRRSIALSASCCLATCAATDDCNPSSRIQCTEWTSDGSKPRENLYSEVPAPTSTRCQPRCAGASGGGGAAGHWGARTHGVRATC